MDEYEVAFKLFDEYLSHIKDMFLLHETRKRETIHQFVIKLRRHAENCSFGDQLSKQIGDQVSDTCHQD